MVTRMTSNLSLEPVATARNEPTPHTILSNKGVPLCALSGIANALGSKDVALSHTAPERSRGVAGKDHRDAPAWRQRFRDVCFAAESTFGMTFSS